MLGFRQSPRPLKGRCGECQYLKICGGNTRVRAYELTGDPWEEDPACYLTNEQIGVTGDFERIPLPQKGGIQVIKDPTAFESPAIQAVKFVR